MKNKTVADCYLNLLVKEKDAFSPKDKFLLRLFCAMNYNISLFYLIFKLILCAYKLRGTLTQKTSF